MKIFSRFREEFSFIRGNLLVLIVSWIFFNFAFTMVFPFESPYIRGLGASPFIIGLLGSLGNIVLTVVRIPGSYIADKHGRKQIIVLMTFGVAFSYIFYAIAPDWRLIIIGVILSNLCLIYQPALEAITADSIPSDKRGIGFAMARVIPSVPSIISPTIAGWIIEHNGLVPGMRVVYALVVLLSLLAAFTRLFFLKETLENPEPMRLSELKGVYKDSIYSILEAWRGVPKSLKALTLAMIISSFEDPIFMQFSALYAFDAVKISEFEWGVINTLWVLATLVLGIPSGKVVDIIGRKKSLILSYLLFTPTTIFFIYSKSFLHLLLVFILFAFGSTIIGPSYSALITDMTPKEKRGRVMGTIGTFNIVARVPASMIGGFLYQIEPSAPFFFTIIIGIIVLVILASLIEEPKVRED